MLNFASGMTVGLLATLAVATHSSSVVRLVPPSASTGTGYVAVAPQSQAIPWWECSLGHTLQHDGQRVRCFQAGKVTDVVPACGFGHALVLNLSGNRDRCRNMSGGMLDYTCPIGYSGVILTGQDVCRKKAADEYIPPIRPAGGLY